MTPSSDSIDQLWTAARPAAAAPLDLAALRTRSSAPLRTSLHAQLTTAAILAVTLAVLCFYFFGLVDLERATSRYGTWLMLGSLALRIGIELVGVGLARRIDRTASTTHFVRATERLLTYRTGVHQGVVAACLTAYTIGYYLLFPEFLGYFSAGMLWLLGLGYPVIMAAVWRWGIWAGLREERVALGQIRAALA